MIFLAGLDEDEDSGDGEREVVDDSEFFPCGDEVAEDGEGAVVGVLRGDVVGWIL